MIEGAIQIQPVKSLLGSLRRFRHQHVKCPAENGRLPHSVIHSSIHPVIMMTAMIVALLN